MDMTGQKTGESNLAKMENRNTASPGTFLVGVPCWIPILSFNFFVFATEAEHIGKLRISVKLNDRNSLRSNLVLFNIAWWNQTSLMGEYQ